MRKPALYRFVKLFWLFTLVLIMAILTIIPKIVAAQGEKPTVTSTITPTETPTATSTDSLKVFETPNTPTPDPQRIFISNPLEESVVYGEVTIAGKTAVAGFSRYDVDFAYSENPTDTWFPIIRSEQPVSDGTLALWDTSILTDGDYILRVRVFFSDGSQRDSVVKGIMVRNYTSTQTPLPTVTQDSGPTGVPAATITQTPSPYPTPSPLPPNPIALSDIQIWITLGRYAVVTILLLAMFGWLIHIRNKNL